MGEIPDDELAASRAVFAPGIAATADLLPWLAQSRPLRFDCQLNHRWIAATRQLASAWTDRHQLPEAVRPAIFILYAIALETADSNCLRLGEALASAADCLEKGEPSSQLIAALSGTIESLHDPVGLEQPSFDERARHFAGRLETATQVGQENERSAVIDRLFVSEALEQLDLMDDALAALPPNAYVLASESAGLAEQAALLELWGIHALAKQLTDGISRQAADLETSAVRQSLLALIQSLRSAITAVDG